jgi:hypothetical protein
MSTRDLPTFSSEAEEAAWWYDNREKHDAEFAQAFAEGRVRRGSVAQRLAAAKQVAMVKLAEQDALAAAVLAEKQGVEVQTYLSELLHTAIKREMERAA